MKFYAAFDLIKPGVDLLCPGLDLHALRKLAFYDALIVQAAITGGCAVLLTEEMQSGAIIGGVRIINPLD